jgi:hypothetical protein
MEMLECENNALFSNLKIPSKIQMKKTKCLCDENAWHVIHNLDSRGENMNVQKRTTPFGPMV